MLLKHNVFWPSPRSLPQQSKADTVLPSVHVFTGVIIQTLARLAPELCPEGTSDHMGRSQLLPRFQRFFKFPVLESCLLSLA